jgi:hypothetical protein
MARSDSGANKICDVIASEAKQSPAGDGTMPARDCFVALSRSSQ